jgi:cell division protein FtsQ
MKLNVFKISFLSLIVIMLTLLSFNKNQSRNVAFNDLSYVDVGFKFISKDSVNKLLTQSKLISNEILKSNLNLKEIERVILSNEYVSSVEVSISIEGKVGVNIIEKNPVFRVLNEEYYIDSNGKKMPLSKNFSEICPMILSDVDSIDFIMFGDLGLFLKNDKFLSNHIAGLTKSNNKLIFNVDGFKYNLNLIGDTNYVSKLKKYEVFFNTVYSSGLLDSLKSVNLDFKNQVIIQRK